jgi:hypothetical protein
MRSRPRPLTLALLLVFPSAVPFAAAAQNGDSMFSFSGFGTIGAVHNSEDHADFATDFSPDGAGYSESWSSKPDSRLGAQLDAQFTGKLSAVVQVLSEYDYTGSHAPDVTLAHVKYAFTPALSVRVGRLAPLTFMLSDYRKVGYAMPWLRPPVEVYSNSIQLDGGEVAYKFNLGSTAMTLQLVTGDSDEGTVKLDDSVGLVARAEFGSSTIFAGYNRTTLSLAPDPTLEAMLALYEPVAPALFERFRLADNDVTFTALGYAYEPGTWFARGEVTRLDSDDGMVAATTNMYASVGRRIGAFMPYVTLGKVELDSPQSLGANDPIGIVNGILANGNVARDSVTVGTRWDFRENFALKLEAAHVRADAGSNGGLTNLQPGFRHGGSYNLLSAAVDFVF